MQISRNLTHLYRNLCHVKKLLGLVIIKIRREIINRGSGFN